jgi:hypothetical protein
MPPVMGRAQFDPGKRRFHAELMAAGAKLAAAFWKDASDT